MAYQIPLSRYAHDQLVDETDLNEFSDLVNYPPWVNVRRTTNQAIVNGAGYVNLSWEAEDNDNDGMWAIGNPTAFVFQHSFVAKFACTIHWPAMAAIGIYIRMVKTPGSIIIGSNGGYGNTANPVAQQVVSKPYPFVIGDIVVIQARHDDTVSRSLLAATDDGCWCSLEFIHSGAFGTV